MILKVAEKEKAIKLRKEGKSLREILVHVPVAKSTLSLWLREVGLSKKQEQRLTEKRIEAQKRGAASRRTQRIELTEKLVKEAQGQVGAMTDRELWLMGIMLYWAEGSKEKPWNTGGGVRFSNSDPEMINLFLLWLVESVKIPREEIGFEIYLHETSLHRLGEVKKYWSKVLRVPLDSFEKVYWKKAKIKTYRKNIGENYFGLVRVKVQASSQLSRKIVGWTKGICKHWGIV